MHEYCLSQYANDDTEATRSTIDDDALIDALQNKKIYAAGLDVFNNEPNLDERYMKLDNIQLHFYNFYF